MTSLGELKIGPQSVSLIGLPISSQPSFAFCTGAIGDASSVPVCLNQRGAQIGSERKTLQLIAWMIRSGVQYRFQLGINIAQRRADVMHERYVAGLFLSDLFRSFDVVALVYCVFAFAQAKRIHSTSTSHPNTKKLPRRQANIMRGAGCASKIGSCRTRSRAVQCGL